MMVTPSQEADYFGSRTGSENNTGSHPSWRTMNSIPALVFSWQIENLKDVSNIKFLYLNHYCQELLGVSPEVALQDPRRIIDLILEDDAASFAAAANQSRSQLCLLDCQIRMRRPTEGGFVTVHFKCRPRREGSVTIWDGIATQLALPQHPEQDAPKAAVKQLVQAERTLTEWLSHEIRNPLSVTMEALQTLQELDGHVDRLQDGYSTMECYQVMSESITYVVDLLNNMMDLDQCAKGCMPVVTAPCTVRDDILLPTYRMMKRLQRQEVPVQLRLSSGARDLEEDIVAHVDKLRLRQVLTNLIANAFHYTTQGFVEVHLQLQDQPTQFPCGSWGSSCFFSDHEIPPRILSFHVRDSGCGVNPGEYDTLFSRWEQLGTSRNGTGIGLCLCQVLVRAMGGSIRLNTEYNSGIEGHRGAEFIVEVPVESAPKLSSKPAAATTRPASLNSLSSALFATTKTEMVEQPPEPPLKQPPFLAMSTPTNSLPNLSRSTSFPPGPEAAADRLHLPVPAMSRDPNRRPTHATLTDLASAVKAQSTRRKPRSQAPQNGSPSPRSSSFFRGRYGFLIVDDEKMGRKFLKRRFSRLFPEATITDVASGEEALVLAATHQYDVITMDHFMAVDEMNGGATIRELRSRLKSDALIVGISGNDKESEHIQAGADLFFQKPLPNDATLVRSLQQHLAPAAGWKVLILSDNASLSAVLTERLHRVASPHFTTQQEAQKRWKILSRSLVSPQEAIDLLSTESFDLVFLVNTQAESQACSEKVRNHLREIASAGDLIVVDCSNSKKRKNGDVIADEEQNHCTAFDLAWSLDSLPSIQEMRRTLCESQLSVGGNPEESKTSDSLFVTVPAGRMVRRSWSGVAKSA